jgi:hypothetical protein
LESVGVMESDMPHVKLPGNFGQTPVIALGSDANQFEPVAVRRDHSQGTLADGTGRAEENDAFSRTGCRHAKG